MRSHPRSEAGASAVEYGLLIAGIAAIVVVAVYAFGGTVRDALFEDSCSTIASAVETSASCG